MLGELKIGIFSLHREQLEPLSLNLLVSLLSGPHELRRIPTAFSYLRSGHRRQGFAAKIFPQSQNTLWGYTIQPLIFIRIQKKKAEQDVMSSGDLCFLISNVISLYFGTSYGGFHAQRHTRHYLFELSRCCHADPNNEAQHKRIHPLVIAHPG